MRRVVRMRAFRMAGEKNAVGVVSVSLGVVVARGGV